jgi:3',5'-cyclic AMP phosphodiesterase CpdA
LLSDTHIPADRINGNRGFNPWANLKRVVPEVAAMRPEGVILNGDAARLEGLPGDYAELRSLLEPLSSLAPVYIGLGNHDDRNNFFKTFPAPPGARQTVKDRHVVVMEHDVARLVILDSLLYVNKTPGLLGQAQRDWLAAYLRQHRDRPVALFVHHTLGEGDGDLLDAMRLFDLVRPHRHVKAVFYGHSHAWRLTGRQGKQLINLPAVGYNFTDREPVGWVEASFRRDGVELTMRAFAGNQADNGRRFLLRWEQG